VILPATSVIIYIGIRLVVLNVLNRLFSVLWLEKNIAITPAQEQPLDFCIGIVLVYQHAIFLFKSSQLEVLDIVYIHVNHMNIYIGMGHARHIATFP